MALPRTARLAYGAADLGASLSFVTLNTWLLYFLVNVVRLPPLQAGAAFLAGRLFDALLDPVMGLLSDRYKERFGRLAFLRWGAVPMGASFALLWFAPTGGAVGFIAATAGFMLFSLLFTVVQVPYMALTPELAPGYDERTELTSYRLAFGTVASLAAVALPPVVVLAATPGELAASGPQGWRLMGILFGALTAAAYSVTAWTLREPPRRPGGPGSGGLLAQARSALKIHGFPEVLALFMAATLGIMLVNSVLPFFLESVLAVPAARQPLVLGLLFAVAVVAFPAWTLLASRLGKRAALAAGLATLAATLLLISRVEAGSGVSAPLLALTALAGCGLSAAMLFPWAMLPDVVEFDELANGRRREGLIYALFTFAQKAAGSAGVFANALIASAVGYVPGSAEQSAATVAGLRAAAGPLAALLFAVAFLLTLRYPISRASHRDASDALARLPTRE